MVGRFLFQQSELLCLETGHFSTPYNEPSSRNKRPRGNFFLCLDKQRGPRPRFWNSILWIRIRFRRRQTAVAPPRAGSDERTDGRTNIGVHGRSRDVDVVGSGALAAG